MSFYDHGVPIIAIDGGPGGGKDDCKKFLLKMLTALGFYPLFPCEGASLMMDANMNLDHGVFSGRTFQRSIMSSTAHLEKIMVRAALECGHPRPVILPNRGMPHSKAYGPRLYHELLEELELGTEVEARDGWYDAVMLMRSTAVGLPELYERIRSNNPHRKETVEEAIERDELTIQAWNGHPHLRVIDNSTDWDGKLARLYKEICIVLGVPTKTEIERKYFCAPCDPRKFPVPTQKIDIDQVYLEPSGPGVVPRVRKRGQDGSFVYYHTEKRFISGGVNEEPERRIPVGEYRSSLKHRVPTTRILGKDRHCFIYENQYFELDLIPTPHDGVVPLLEIELSEVGQMPRLPPFVPIIKEVTDDPHFTNRAIAELSWRL